MLSFSSGDIAVVIGATGGIGSALVSELEHGATFTTTVCFSRSSRLPLNLLSESDIAACARHVASLGVPRLIINATGILHEGNLQPEKTWRQIDPSRMSQVFAINTIGPALLMKYFLPLLPREGKSVFATLSARVGSIEDNHLGGWYSYRASKAALNQLVRTAAVEIRRGKPEAICVVLHPGTVNTQLTSLFSKSGLEVQAPALAAERLLAVIESLGPNDSGNFFDHYGKTIPW
jgi:NAD(P)-dependent dehydrogenase (short-subunit alcohol dehydrogenase family)